VWRSLYKEDRIMKKLKFSVIGIQHGHIYGMCADLIKAGGELVSAYDKDEAARAEFAKRYPDVKIAASENEILEDQSVSLVTGAAITSERADIGIRVMKSGKDYFVDKGPFTTLSQLEEVKKAFESPIIITKKSKKGMVDVDLIPGVLSCFAEKTENAVRIRVELLAKQEGYVNPDHLVKGIGAKLGRELWDYDIMRTAVYDDGGRIFR